MKAMFEYITDRVLSRLRLNFSVEMGERLCSQVTQSLYLGAKPKVEQVSELKAAGVTHVVSCLAQSQRSQIDFLQQDFRHLFLGLHDGMHEDIAATFAQFVGFAAAAAAEPDAKLLVHCEVGVSRSATLVIALLMKVESMSFFEALSRVRSKRIQVLPNIGFASQLQRLEHELQPGSVTDAPSSLARYLREVCSAPAEIDLLQAALEQRNYDAPSALELIFGGDIPRVVQGVRS